MDYSKITSETLKSAIADAVSRFFGVKAEEASNTQMYQAVCIVVRDMLTNARVEFKRTAREINAKHVYYMSMEFLLGRSLRNHLFNMGIDKKMVKAVKELGFDIDTLYAVEPDAGLGNGGLGRLAAAYLDSLTSLGYIATGFSIMYDYGIFKQRIVDGEQIELPDEWLTNGAVWLQPRLEDTFEVRFGGVVDQEWNDGKLKVIHRDYNTVLAVPYDMNISGIQPDTVNRLRLWSAKASTDFDMELFSKGEYVKAMESRMMAESISKVLYPADDHIEGKSLRLKQQYFFVSASIQSIIKRHLQTNPSLDNLAEHAAIHINDTHPTLCIPELMRILLDEYGYGWDRAWQITCDTVSYTNHTVMAEALEKWPQQLFQTLLPRIFQIVCEINRRYCDELWRVYPGDNNKVAENAILEHGQIKMATLCLVAANTINGVSALHSEILKHDIFKDYYERHPQKFTNVTNGITHRRWVQQANPGLTALLHDTIGDGWIKDASKLKKLEKFKNDSAVLERLEKVKYENKLRLAEYIRTSNGVVVNPDSIFDIQAKRLHEYKRQLLNAMNILDTYYTLKENPSLDICPRTYVFGAKAASSYYMAKQIIRLIWQLGEVINNDKSIDDKLKVVFLENYRVSLAEIMIPAAEVSEQISIAGKEASGTGNMKFMINGAVTLGTMDGANVEINEAVGNENMFIFGMSSDEVRDLYNKGYDSAKYYSSDYRIKRVIDGMRQGIGGVKFGAIADNLVLGNHGIADPYMCLADFDSYSKAQKRVNDTYTDKKTFDKMSLMNIANAGFFSADRAVKEYADRIWNVRPINKL
ncbi:MAG: glycogen/starch/alpha-glucan phosphorylase [Eubacteriales bacterium]|nr:glycogen/starch/alpha-glucan phosphorylase [Christensenellaceae bacterium]MDD7092416.1 glycogen/starch/alpha-glucan phosphorylase [Christensenellaceae bacterium]MDY3241278.1 glycogen/starch/alpha-glucan phosphorylase [Eubacteriales bacterium]